MRVQQSLEYGSENYRQGQRYNVRRNDHIQLWSCRQLLKLLTLTINIMWGWFSTMSDSGFVVVLGRTDIRQGVGLV